MNTYTLLCLFTYMGIFVTGNQILNTLDFNLKWNMFSLIGRLKWYLFFFLIHILETRILECLRALDNDFGF